MIKLKIKNLIFLPLMLISIVICSFFLINPPITNNNNLEFNSSQENNEINLSNQGYVDSSDKKVFWFIHVTDAQHIWYNDVKIGWFNRFLNESFKLIQPALVYNTGDLVDSDFDDFIIANERDQRIEEWVAYNKSLHDNNMNSTVYMDVAGNHDVYGDADNPYFLKYSMMGQSFNTLQYAFKKSFSFGEYGFIGLHTAEDYGAKYPFGLFGYLSNQELDWYEEELNRFKDCEKIFTFGHHPPFEILSGVNSNRNSYFSLNKKHNVFSYFCGHGHINAFQNVNGMFAIETTRFDLDGGSYRIVAVDNNFLSTSLEFVGKWPQGIITYPPREDYINEDLNEIQKIRALAWDPKGVDTVQWSAYDLWGANKIVDWRSMTNVTDNRTLWEADWETSLNDGSDYLIKVKINGGSGEIIKEIRYSSQKSFYMHLSQWIPIFYTSFIAFVALVVVRTYYRRTYVPKYKKKQEEKVDKKLRKLYLLKWVIFFAVPLTIGGMYIGKITAVFAFVHVNSYGILINGLQFIYGGVLFLFGLFLQGFRLSHRARKGLTADIILSLSFTGFMLAFYILHFPALSWISPGLYGMIIIDYFMLKRNIEMKRETRILE